MKRTSLFLIVVLFVLLNLFGCKPANPLYDSVSELREKIFYGSCDSMSIKAGYGFKEYPFNNDAKVAKKVYLLDFRLIDKSNQDATYTLTFDFNGKTYNKPFKFDPIKDSVCAIVEIENFDATEFPVVVSVGGERHEMLLKSIVPENTISYKTALDHLYKQQSSLVKSFSDESGRFNAEIYLRLVIKDDKPYWYLGIANGGDRLKAMLIDGFSGEILAIREVF